MVVCVIGDDDSAKCEWTDRSAVARKDEVVVVKEKEASDAVVSNGIEWSAVV